MTPLTHVLTVLSDVLDLLTVGPCALTLEPCRVVLAPGATVAWDSCESGDCAAGKNGQLYANPGLINVTDQGSGCQTLTWQADIGIVRCAKGVVRSDGSPPSADDIEADAWQQALDADQIVQALTCCAERTEAIRDLALISWNALGPSGGCVGGLWTVRGQASVCC